MREYAWYFINPLCPNVCLFGLILYVHQQSYNYELCRDGSSWVEPVLMCLAQGRNAVTPVRLVPAAPQS